MNDKYSFNKELQEKLKKYGIDYPDGSCPVVWHPEGWNWDSKDFLIYLLPPNVKMREWHGDNIKSHMDAAIPMWEKEYPEDAAVRFCWVRSQLFISEEADKLPKYIIYQPYTNETNP